jgi:uncharacterized protein
MSRTQLRSVNPFTYARPVEPAEVTGRDDEIAHLLALAEGGHNVTVYGPRRFGKTSLVMKLLHDAELEAGMVPVLVDLSDVLSPLDLAIRLERAYRALRGPVGRAMRELLANVQVSVPLGPARLHSPERGGATEDPLATVHDLLELPARMAERTGRRGLVVLDEFQALMALEGMDGVFRSHIQHHGSSASYVFSGSEPTLLRGLFEDRARPLYGQAELMRLGRLPPRPTADYVAARFLATGKSAGEPLGRLVAVAAGHPQRVMLLAHRLWEEVPAGGEATRQTVDVAIEATLRQLDAELEEAWRALSLNERRVLAAIASGLSPYAAAAAEATGLRARSSAQRAVEALVTRTVVEAHEGREPSIVDPLFELWIARRGQPHPAVYVLPARDGEAWEVLDGPSRNFLRGAHFDLAAAEEEAERIAADSGGLKEVVVYPVDEPDDLPDWARG